MSIPGFTEEASVYQSSGRYTAVFGAHDSGRVLSQLITTPVKYPLCQDCIWDTFDYPTPTCAQLCIDGPISQGNLPYPVECDPSQCPQRCFRCLPRGLGYSGLWRYCVGGASGYGQWVPCLPWRVG
jgi:hypothetical protein